MKILNILLPRVGIEPQFVAFTDRYTLVATAPQRTEQNNLKHTPKHLSIPILITNTTKLPKIQPQNHIQPELQPKIIYYVLRPF